jgi:hypothetical protein
VVKLEFIGRAKAEKRQKLEFFFSTIPYRTITEQTWEAAEQ